MNVERAYGEAAKARRRNAIIDAAEELLASSLELPTAAAIAARVGLAKGTLFRYFETLEELFTALLLERWCTALDELTRRIENCHSTEQVVNEVLGSFVNLSEKQQWLMMLDTMLPEFRRKLSDDWRREFEETISSRMARTGAFIEMAIGLDTGRGFTLLVRSQAFARGLWQSCNNDNSPFVAGASPLQPYPIELRRALVEYWRGALTES